MQFCPDCANLLLYELPNMGRRAGFYCPTCPYVAEVDNRVKIKKNVRLVKKPIDPIFSENDLRSMSETSATCPNCNHEKASFYQTQTRSADEPMTVFYTCKECKHIWRED